MHPQDNQDQPLQHLMTHEEFSIMSKLQNIVSGAASGYASGGPIGAIIGGVLGAKSSKAGQIGSMVLNNMGGAKSSPTQSDVLGGSQTPLKMDFSDKNFASNFANNSQDMWR